MDANGTAMPEAIWQSFESREALAQALASAVAAQLLKAIKARDKALLIVSGGSTPVAFFQTLAQQSLPWENLTVMLADERWVDPAHTDSNEKLVREHLLAAQPQVHLFSLAPQSGEALQQGAQRLQQALTALALTPDMSILGMGEDGHTASLFPNHPALEAGLNPQGDVLCLAIDDSPKPPPQRITLTAALLNQSRSLMLHITGDAKRVVYEQGAALPARRLLEQHGTPATIYWAA